MSSSKPQTKPLTLEGLVRWARLKKYRIEVTYGVYVYTPVEKAIFWTIFCFLFGVISFAALLYTKRNVSLLLKYAYIYVNGSSGATSAVSNLLPRRHTALSLSGNGIKSLAETMGGATNSQVP
ncbi:uncharacterized protein GGS22DRAFT_160216 [Annulohypoxylon maeteangense]|uniref:uncharacterized protein n=1 Tax=Annulohypoxylon maeteangense TaxID=1927788 RepID=UPI002008E2AB|nr:uncharacterized protein GGS22DRAFT_160216 [Annulohypoxylon maeteangense]KAI0886195.1 hypothetical protein GGS22DRAFT_160216 [Annulohypoxylon maeteangense]